MHTSRQPIAVRARAALAQIARHGGKERFPGVLTSQDVKPLIGVAWFHEALRAGRLPGVQIVVGGVWRCDRDTFVAWLEEVSDETSTALALAERHGSAVAPRTGMVDG
ncbi:MAG TPA: hypothetical protein PKA05_07995 [Roseiflexaceae bacterium]|nr:hypothetical protein [Roseiflexaceae bacterium]HMP40305.1 hypothetical protein [Roseiflexaceae bacterium]